MTGPAAPAGYPVTGYPVAEYPVQFSVDYPDRPLSRLSTAFRLILITGRYPKGMFGFVEGVIRWNVRVTAYVLTLVTDRYPPFRLAPLRATPRWRRCRPAGRRH